MKLVAEDWESMSKQLEEFLQDLATGTASRARSTAAGGRRQEG
jgi:hypothetical protein